MLDKFEEEFRPRLNAVCVDSRLTISYKEGFEDCYHEVKEWLGKNSGELDAEPGPANPFEGMTPEQIDEGLDLLEKLLKENKAVAEPEKKTCMTCAFKFTCDDRKEDTVVCDGWTAI